MTEPLEYRVAIPSLYADDLREAVAEVAVEEGAEAGLRVEDVPLDEEALSELGFDPFLIAAGIYVGHLLVNAGAGMVARAVLEKVIAKIRGKRPAEPQKIEIEVLTSDLRSVRISIGSDDGTIKIQLEGL